MRWTPPARPTPLALDMSSEVVLVLELTVSMVVSKMMEAKIT